MSVVETSYEHIILNEKNQAIIEGTRIKVIELVLDKIAYGWSPEELQYQHPQLTLGQVYSALAYYADHQEELDKEIETQLQQIDQLRESVRPTPLVQRLKAKKLI
ncbi:MAG: DUF433 domain-containing protein [bacterium]